MRASCGHFSRLLLRTMGVMAMGCRAIWRVWYGKRLGIPQSFEDIGSFDGAANFAAFIEADRIVVVRETDGWPPAEIAG